MSNPNREFDKTYLSIDGAEERGLVHRDYIAHCLRWSHVAKCLNKGKKYETAIVLDVGCGKEMPLAKTLYVNKMSPAQYIGVDINRMGIPEMLVGKKIKIRLYAETDICRLRPQHVGLQLERSSALDPPRPQGINPEGNWEDGENEAYALPNVVTCFEVLEHVTPAYCRRMLKHLLTITSHGCEYFFSTPCWNGSAAENHINEMTFKALGALFEDVGYRIEAKYGTFASIKDYEDKMDRYPGLDAIFRALRDYYDTNLLATMFAPLFPANSRNVLWHLRKKPMDYRQSIFQSLASIAGPWSQHPDWRELAEEAPQT